MKQPLSPIFKIVLSFAILIFPILFAWVTLKKGFTKTYKTVSFLWLAFYIVAIALAPSPDQETKAKAKAKELKILSISDFDYSMNELPAVSISIGEDINNYCGITLNRKDISTRGVSFKSKKNINRAISAECMWNKSHYIQSSKHPTEVSVTFSDVDTTMRTGSITLSLKLVNAKGYDTFFELNDTVNFYNDEMFDNLFFN